MTTGKLTDYLKVLRKENFKFSDEAESVIDMHYKKSHTLIPYEEFSDGACEIANIIRDRFLPDYSNITTQSILEDSYRSTALQFVSNKISLFEAESIDYKVYASGYLNFTPMGDARVRNLELACRCIIRGEESRSDLFAKYVLSAYVSSLFDEIHSTTYLNFNRNIIDAAIVLMTEKEKENVLRCTTGKFL